MDVTLAELPDFLERFEYPASRDEVAAETRDVTIELADGEVILGDLVADASSETFESADDLHTSVQNELPREAVGEPYQSEGEG